MENNNNGEIITPSYEEINSSKEKRNKTILIIIIAILGFIIITLSIFLALTYKKEIDTRNNVTLKYTETFNTTTEGIYITDVSEIVSNAMPSIVAITSKTLVSSGNFGPFYFGKDQYSTGAGSGIIIGQTDKSIMILTNNHVVSGAKELSVQFIDGESYDAKIVGTSERKDIAVISVSTVKVKSATLEEIRIATMGSSDDLKVGNGIIAIGNALGYGQSVTTGVVSALNREVKIDNHTNKMIQLDAAINGGNSGGALLNSKGEVIGINSAKYSSSSSSSASVEGMGFAIPISDVSSLIETLMNGESDEIDASIGIEGYIISEAYSKAYNIPVGFYVVNIVEGSGADASDLEIGNIIIEIEGNKVNEMSDIENVLYEHKKGDTISLKVKYVSGRNYKEKTIKIKLS